ncbi:MAG TPA: hypothetical protein VM869_06715 [Enhygromyxa sp.]|nr:hypothetical protein [Enhygromyxa sp.]
MPAPGRACTPWTAISVMTVCPIEKPWPGCIVNSGVRWPLKKVPLVLPRSLTRTLPFSK